jgi:hypothetical protein
MSERMPRPELTQTGWTEATRAEFIRRRKGRNVLLLVALGGFCLVIYAIALVKLHQYGTMW